MSRTRVKRENVPNESEILRSEKADLEAKYIALGKQLELLKTKLHVFIDHSIDTHVDYVNLVSKGDVSVQLNLDLAVGASEYLRKAVGKIESETINIEFEKVEPKILKIVVAMIKLGECAEEIRIPSLTSQEAFELMELSIMMEMPRICETIARRLSDFTTFDAKFLDLANRQQGICGSDYREVWGSVCLQAINALAIDIEHHSTSPEFAKLPMDLLDKIIEAIDDESWPDSYSEGSMESGQISSSSNGFQLIVKKEQTSISTFVTVSHNHATGIQLLISDDKPVGIFDIEIRAVPKHSTSTPLARDSRGRAMYCTWILGFKNFFDCHPSQDTDVDLKPESFTFLFKARMKKLHRQCLALLNYARRHVVVSGVNDCLLLEVLKYFDMTPGKSSEKFKAILSKYASRAFAALKTCRSFQTLRCQQMEWIIKNHELNTNAKEETVLKAVVKWCMSCQAAVSSFDATDPGQAEATIESSAVAKASNIQTDFERLIRLVRFPFIPTASMATVLDKDELAFAQQHTVFHELVDEALECQSGRRRPEEVGDGRASKRARYSDIPALDLQLMRARLFGSG